MHIHHCNYVESILYRASSSGANGNQEIQNFIFLMLVVRDSNYKLYEFDFSIWYKDHQAFFSGCFLSR